MPAIENTYPGLSLRTGDCGFPLATLTEKIEEKRNPPKKSLAVLYPGHLLHLPGNVKF